MGAAPGVEFGEVAWLQANLNAGPGASRRPAAFRLLGSVVA
jgi:hypothetical protein